MRESHDRISSQVQPCTRRNNRNTSALATAHIVSLASGVERNWSSGSMPMTARIVSKRSRCAVSKLAATAGSDAVASRRATRLGSDRSSMWQTASARRRTWRTGSAATAA